VLYRVLIASTLLTLGGCVRPADELPNFGVVPEFQLTSHTGRAFNSMELRGKVWVADFIFTNCPGPCPRMTGQMRSVQDALSEVRLVSFTIDPNRDTPEVLTAYAGRHHADLSRWYFLTGPVEKLHHLKRDVFLLGNVDGVTFEHSTRFVLVDGQSRIRGFYTTAEPDEVKKLIADTRRLLKENG
jgi:protein SCO1/2